MSRKLLHIVYLGPFRFPDGDAAAARVLNNARCLRSLGHKVEFLSFGGNGIAGNKPMGEYDGFSYRITNDIDRSKDSILKRVLNFLVQGNHAYALLRSLNPDVVVAYNPALVLTLRLMRLSKKKNFRFIADLTEYYQPSEFPGGRWLPFSWMNEWNMRVVMRRVRHKLVISSFLNRMYPASQNLLLPPLVDLQEAKWQAETIELPPFDGITCIYAGTPTRKDKVLFLLDALRLATSFTDRVRLLFIGEELEEVQQKMNEPAMAVCRDRILFSGRVAQQEVPACYRAADFSLLFREDSRKNKAGFPTKFVESMASGVPVLCNLTTDLGNFLINGKNGFVLSDPNPQELAGLFAKLSQVTPAELDAMKQAATATARGQFDYRVYQPDLQEFLTKITKK